MTERLTPERIAELKKDCDLAREVSALDDPRFTLLRERNLRCSEVEALLSAASRESRMAPVVEAAIAMQEQSGWCCFCDFDDTAHPHDADCPLVANGWGRGLGTMAKTCTIQIDVKEPDTFGDLQAELRLSDEKRRAHFQWGEYATFELEIDEQLNVVSGRILPVKP